jgi:hypothetical protein
MKTIDLELAKELQQICKEKGIELPESYFGWYYQEITETYIVMTGHGTLSEYIAPDYTLDELLEWLFAKANYISIKSDISPKKGWTAWCEVKGWMVYQEDPNPTNACAKLLIYLIKKGLI